MNDVKFDKMEKRGNKKRCWLTATAQQPSPEKNIKD